MNNKGADKPELACIVISAFVIRLYLNFLIFYLVSIAEQAGLNLTKKLS